MSGTEIICSRCALTSGFPGISFDEEGICCHCSSWEPGREPRRRRLKRELELALESSRGEGGYHCVVAFSGGKDSTYTLMTLVREYRVRCLAVTVDNGFLSEQAYRNCRSVVRSLGVDALTFTPSIDFMTKLYRVSGTEPGVHPPAAVKRASGICNSCIGLINSYLIKTALLHRAPMVAGGYVSGQVPKDSAVLELNLAAQARSRESTLERYRRYFGPEAHQYFAFPETEGKGKLTVLNPMLLVEKTDEEVMAEIAQLGWQPTHDTGRNSSNCLINDLGIALHRRQFGFHPYAFELSEQIREGRLTREKALEKLSYLPGPDELRQRGKDVGLDLPDLLEAP